MSLEKKFTAAGQLAKAVIWDKPINRRAFVAGGLELLVLSAAGGFLAGKISHEEPKKFNDKPIGPEKPVKRSINELMTETANREFILRTAPAFMSLAPGDYNLNIESSYETGDETSIISGTRRSSGLNREGKDERSRKEMSLMAQLEASRNPILRKQVQDGHADLANIIDEEIGTDWATGLKPATPGDIMLALQAAGSQYGRAWGMNILWNMQQSGELEKYGIPPLSQEKINWARSEGIDERALAWAMTARPVILDILRRGADIFFNGVKDPLERKARVANLESSIMNEGALAKLLMLEHRAFVYIGDTPWSPQINYSSGYYPSADFDMRFTAQYLEQKTGLPYTQSFINKFDTKREYYQYIPGSARGNGASGGAVFGQFMPVNLHKMITNIERVLDKLKADGIYYGPVLPGTPLWMAVMTGVYEGGFWKQFQGYRDGTILEDEYHFKGGYIQQNIDMGVPGATQLLRESPMYRGVFSWNQFDEEIMAVILAGQNYAKKFPTDASK